MKSSVNCALCWSQGHPMLLFLLVHDREDCVEPSWFVLASVRSLIYFFEVLDSLSNRNLGWWRHQGHLPSPALSLSPDYSVAVLRPRFWRSPPKIQNSHICPMTPLARGPAQRTLSAQPPTCPPNSSLWRTTPTPLSGCSCFSWHCGCWWCSWRLRLPCILLEAPSLWWLCAALRSVCCPPISIRNASGAFIFSVILIQIASGRFWIQEGNDTLWGKTFRNLCGRLLHSFIF